MSCAFFDIHFKYSKHYVCWRVSGPYDPCIVGIVGILQRISWWHYVTIDVVFVFQSIGSKKFWKIHFYLIFWQYKCIKKTCFRSMVNMNRMYLLISCTHVRYNHLFIRHVLYFLCSLLYVVHLKVVCSISNFKICDIHGSWTENFATIIISSKYDNCGNLKPFLL